MAKVRIGHKDATSVSQLLVQISQLPEVPEDLKRQAFYWASEVRRTMDRDDLQIVAWLLRDASAYRRKPIFGRDKTRYWAAYLEGRM
jgi:hypothetical protein